MKKRSTLTFPQPVLEAGVTPPFPVEIDAVTDENGPAHPRGYRARLAAHHLSGGHGCSAENSGEFEAFTSRRIGLYLEQEVAERLKAGRTRKDPAV